MKLFLTLVGTVLASQQLQTLNVEYRQQPVESAAEAQARVESMTWQTQGFYVCCGLLLLVLCIYPCAGAKRVNLEPTTEEDVDKLKDQIVTEKEKLEADWNRINDGMDGEDAKTAMLEENPEAPMDFDQMMQTMFKSVSDQVGGKMAKEGAVRKIIENRMGSFGTKAQSFMLSKFNDTAKDLMTAVDREEELLLLEWNEAVEANFPPASVVIAGLLSPLMIKLSMLNHLSQGLLLFLPFMCLCFVSLYIDHGVPCPGIPGMQWWLYTHTFLTVVLFFAHMRQLMILFVGWSTLSKKSEEVGAKLKEIESHEEQGLSDMRDIFVGKSVLVQQALLVEDQCRKSPAYGLVGILTMVWMVTFIWTVVLVIGWTFVPGVAAFHASAQATAGDDFCGTWMTVLTARLLSVAGLIFLLVNALTVARWMIDTLTHSEQFEKKLMKQCKRFDDAAGGIPVCQILGKALVLRGSSDTVYAEMNVCTNRKITLERRVDELTKKAAAADAALDAKNSAHAALEEKGGGDNSFGGMIARLETQDDTASWKNCGIKAIQAAEERNAQTTEALQKGTPDLDIFVERVTQRVDEIRNSKDFKDAAEASQKFAEETKKKAEQAAGDLAAATKKVVEETAKKAGEAMEAGKEAMEAGKEAIEAGTKAVASEP